MALNIVNLYVTQNVNYISLTLKAATEIYGVFETALTSSG
jgi:hypothetical protein